MNKAVGIIGWVLAVTLLAATAFLYRVNQDLDTRLSDVLEEREGILVKVDEQAQRNAELAEVVARLSEGLEKTQARMYEVEKVTYALETRRPSILYFLDDIYRFLTGTERAWSFFDSFGDLRGIVDPQAISDAMGNVLDRDFAESAASMTVDVQYDAFIQGLNLDDPAREEEIRDAFIEGTKRKLEQVSEIVRGDLDVDEQAEDLLRDSIATVLSPDELERFDVFRNEETERTTRRNFDIQLGLFANELTPENRERVLDVFVAETLRARSEDGAASGNRLDASAWIDTQRTVYERTLERLRAELDDEQYEVVERFADGQLRMLDVGSNLLDRLFRRGDPAPL